MQGQRQTLSLAGVMPGPMRPGALDPWEQKGLLLPSVHQRGILGVSVNSGCARLRVCTTGSVRAWVTVQVPLVPMCKCTRVCRAWVPWMCPGGRDTLHGEPPFT